LKVFVNQEVNPSGLLCFNIYVRGIPRISCVDDTLPFAYVNSNVIPLFAQIGIDGALFGPLIEKMWAKLNGSYERVQAGW
jgi:hypothetical protein